MKVGLPCTYVGVAKFTLTRSGIRVERRRHRTLRWQWQYRIDLTDPIGFAGNDGGTPRR